MNTEKLLGRLKKMDITVRFRDNQDGKFSRMVGIIDDVGSDLQYTVNSVEELKTFTDGATIGYLAGLRYAENEIDLKGN